MNRRRFLTLAAAAPLAPIAAALPIVQARSPLLDWQPSIPPPVTFEPAPLVPSFEEFEREIMRRIADSYQIPERML